jgi:hypothetical protein
MIREEHATAISDDMVDATVALKLLSRSRIPPARKQHPRTWFCQCAIRYDWCANWTHKEDVGENATEHAGLHDADLALAEGNNGDDEFDSISKGRIHQAAQCLSQFGRDLFGRKGQQRGEGHNGDKVEAEDGDRVPAECAGNDADGHENQEDVDIVAAEGGPDGARNMLGHRLPLGLIAVGSAGEQRRLLVGRAVQDSAVAAAGRHDGARVRAVETRVASCSIELSPYVFYVPRSKQLAKVSMSEADGGSLLSRWLRRAEGGGWGDGDGGGGGDGVESTMCNARDRDL